MRHYNLRTLMLTINRGRCHALFAYDIAFSIDLSEAERRITAIRQQRETIKHKRRAPRYFQYRPLPVRVSQATEKIAIGGFQTNGMVDLVLYDFGAVSVNYAIPIEGPFKRVVDLGCELYENAVLLEDSERRVKQFLEMIQPAVSKPHVSAFVEDYVVYQIEELNAPPPLDDFVAQNENLLAQILRAETRELSWDEIRDALSRRISFSSADVTIVDWNAALLVDQDSEDNVAVLEFANVELMEMRYLDRRLDDALGLAYEALSRQTWKRFPFRSDHSALHKLAQWQVDSAVLFEGVNNALKLIGDQYLARLYRVAAERLHLSEWDASIIRKLETLDSIYGKISDRVATQRMELLEWIIIVLIAVSIALPFFISYSG
jgi:hypothetical protein